MHDAAAIRNSFRGTRKQRCLVDFGQFKEHDILTFTIPFNLSLTMIFSKVKQFVSIINSDALLFLSNRLSCIFISITSVVLICRAVTVQKYFLTDGLGIMYDSMAFGPLAYSMAWSIVSLILPGCHRKYHPGLDVTLDFLGMALQMAVGGALLQWSFMDGYEVEWCEAADTAICKEAAMSLSVTEKSTAILLFLISITHFIMLVRAVRTLVGRRQHYRPSRNSWMRFDSGRDETVMMQIGRKDAAPQSIRKDSQFSATTKPSIDSNQRPSI